jgi:glucose dehydrogenase
MIWREIALAVVLLVGLGLIVMGVSLVSVPWAFVVAGLGLIAATLLFIYEVT